MCLVLQILTTKFSTKLLSISETPVFPCTYGSAMVQATVFGLLLTVLSRKTNRLRRERGAYIIEAGSRWLPFSDKCQLRSKSGEVHRWRSRCRVHVIAIYNKRSCAFRAESRDHEWGMLFCLAAISCMIYGVSHTGLQCCAIVFAPVMSLIMSAA